MTSCDDLDITALEIPYQYGKTSVVVLLPNNFEGLSNLEGQQTRNLKKKFYVLRNHSRVELHLSNF